MQYQIMESSNHRCCFEYSVVDVDTKRVPEDDDDRYEVICECYDKRDAELICAAVNQYKTKAMSSP